jgi:outer membrane receptor protein involved in Fe transport
MKSPSSVVTLCLGLAGALPSGAFAQVAPAPQTGGNEDPIQLSPFTVTTDKDVGYVASSSLAGSRLNTSLKDTAASISVLTEEFLADIAATDLTRAVGYANNVELELNDAVNTAAPNGNVLVTQDQSYRIRSMPATLARNFFETEIPTDTYNVSRIEDSRGPNAVLFGIAEAGGLINSATKQAFFGRDLRRLALTAGSYDSFRGTLDVNQVAIDRKLAVRFNAVYSHTNSFRRFLFNETQRGDVAVKYQFRPTTSLRAEFERGNLRANVARPFNLTDGSQNWLASGRPTVNAPVATNGSQGLLRLGNAARVTYIANTDQLINLAGRMSTSGSSTILTNPAMTDRSINVSGPGTLRSGEFYVGSAYLEHQFSRHTFLELGFNTQKYETDSRDPSVSSSNLLGDPNRFLPTGAPNPYAGQLLLETAWLRTTRTIESDSLRALVTSVHDAGKWGEYRFVGVGEYTDGRFRNSQMAEFWDGAPFHADPENAANQVYRRNYVTEGDWGTYYISSDKSSGPIVNRVDPISGRTLSSTWFPRSNGSGDVPTTQKSALLGVQTRHFGSRLVGNFGYRYDRVSSIDRDQNVRDPVTRRLVVNYTGGVDIDYSGDTKTAGLVAHVTRHLSLLGNYATNAGLPNPRNSIVPGTKAPGRTGQGSDLGAAVTLLEGRLYARGVYFETAGQNLTGTRGTFVLNTTNDRVLEALVANRLITPAEAATHDLGAANVSTYDLKSSGYEFQVTANPARNWRLMANFSITDAREENIAPEVKAWTAENFPFWEQFDQSIVTSAGLTIGQEKANVEEELNTQYETEGLTVFGNRKYKVNVFTRYSFSTGTLKGLSLGAGYRHQSKNVIGRDTANGEVHGNSFSLVDAMVGYDLRPFSRRVAVRLQLNVTNVLDDLDPLILRYQGAQIRRYKLADPREWRLSATLDF